MCHLNINGLNVAPIDESQLSILLQAEKKINSGNNSKDILLIAVNK